MSQIEKLEYRVRKVERYVITRYEEREDGSCGSGTRGEYDNPDVAWETAYALCRLEHEKHLGYRIDDDRVQYPRHPNSPADRVGDDVKMFVSNVLRDYDQGKIGGGNRA